MHEYQLPQKLISTFQENPWWTFMGKYYGFPDCCVQNFCSTDERIPSPFTGTGYVPCPCCNKKLTNDLVVQEFTQEINHKRYHNFPFGMDDAIENNTQFFSVLESFYTVNEYFPYEEIIFRGGQQYLFEKFLNKSFSFILYLENIKTKEPLAVDLTKVISAQDFPWIFNDFVEGRLTKNKKMTMLEEINLEKTHSIDSIKTRDSINSYLKDIDHLYFHCAHLFYGNIQKTPKNIANKITF